MALAAGYLIDIIRAFRGYKKLGDAGLHPTVPTE